jgi:hypothetical protein
MHLRLYNALYEYPLDSSIHIFQEKANIREHPSTIITNRATFSTDSCKHDSQCRVPERIELPSRFKVHQTTIHNGMARSTFPMTPLKPMPEASRRSKPRKDTSVSSVSLLAELQAVLSGLSLGLCTGTPTTFDQESIKAIDKCLEYVGSRGCCCRTGCPRSLCVSTSSETLGNGDQVRASTLHSTSSVLTLHSEIRTSIVQSTLSTSASMEMKGKQSKGGAYITSALPRC